jgi:hypothetical protein
MQASFRFTDSMRPSMATGYVDRWDPMRAVLWALFPDTRGRLYGARIGRHVELREYDLFTPAIGGLVGSVVDFGRFLQAHLTGGGPVLSPGWTARMHTQIAEGAAGIESREGMALGWKVGRVRGHALLNHEGGGAGFTTELRLYPDAEIGVAIAMNAMRMPSTMRLAHRLCELLLGARHHLGDSAVRAGVE